MPRRAPVNSTWIVAGLMLWTAIVYFPVCEYPFVAYDDNLCVTDNPQVLAGLTAEGFAWAWTTTHHANWHPLTWMSFMLDAELFGLWAGGYHLTNLLLHMGAVAALFAALRKMSSAVWPAALVAALYAVHPLHVQSVAWVGERKGLLADLFWILTMLAYAHYVKRPSVRGYLWTCGAFVAGLLSKQLAVTLPFALLLFDYWPLERWKSARWNWLIVEKLPLLALAGGFTLVAYLAQKWGGALRSEASFPLAVRMANAAVSYAEYLRKAFWPSDLAIFYPHTGKLPASAELIGSVALLLAISVLSLVLIRRWPVLFVGWWFYLGTMVPQIGLVQIGDHRMADRYTDIPLIGIYLIVAWGLWQFAGRGATARKLALWSPLLAATALASVAMREVRYWQSSESLFQRAIAVTTDNFLAHGNLGVVYLETGRADQAIDQLERAVASKPDYVLARRNLARAYAGSNQYAQAAEQLRQLWDVPAPLHEDRHNLGTVLMRQDRYEEAASAYRGALALDPRAAATHYGLGNALAKLGDQAGALAAYREALNCQPGFEPARQALAEASGQ